jgi:small-conductance mechanosensitive channel
VIGWALWEFLSSYYQAYAPKPASSVPSEEDSHPETEASRLTTVLPLLRDLGFGTVIAITALVILSSLGIDIGPLLAGFGVIGLALSFGTQALVRDFVSGIFFIADDAFRVGEYIDTGRLKGTVEKISLRSLRLRHQNGQIHTLPFGQLQSITNFSRDWSTIKFELRFDPSSDPEVIRKTVKAVGLEMMQDEEMAAQLLLPLKMQGIQDLTETAMIVRLKFTAKPGNPTFIQRQAMKRLLTAARDAGLHLASNAVTVRSGSAEDGAAANLIAKPAATTEAT